MNGDEQAIPKRVRKRPRRAAYALPTLFTSGNIFLGFVAILQAFQGALQAGAGDFGINSHFVLAAKALGFAAFLDALDGGIARLTNTASDFGRELDSLADAITFGLAPAVLALTWGVLFAVAPDQPLQSHLTRVGYLVSFFYLLCGTVRLARFNVQTNPSASNAMRPERKYFAGMPIPAGALFVAAVVYMEGSPVRSFALAVTWMCGLAIVSLLMVSTWRYPSFKQISVSKPHTPLIVVLIGGAAFLIWNWAQPMLLAMACAYVASGICMRIGGFIRRRRKSRPPARLPERQVG
ncbi:MAG: CDP-alcohol phosphatidyltransferase family protein [Bryobacteraceae bacterium]